ncbi:uncharacterized protein LOC113323441 [Papaver somniferum]|uniref:uncharacterized protein LOC113323441 n=1 Tax=Papaver somniferum TaxID=3469 RepID=UPI000E704DAC|nr:uncharacterized protein LOC113323441 [Papaver somniferum]
MYRFLWCKLGVNLKRTTAIINGESSSSSLTPATAKYFLFRIQDPNVFVISNSRVTSAFSSFSTTATSNVNTFDSSSFGVSYLINSCGLSESEAITASKKINFKTTSNPDSVLTLLKTYGFTESHISKIINREPSILLSKPDKTLKPKLDFFKSKGLFEHDLTSFISRSPRLLTRCLKKEIVPSFDTLRSVVQSDENVTKMMKRNPRIINTDQVKRVVVNVELLRNEGVPETNIRKGLTAQPRAFTVNGFKENLEKVKDMGFDNLQATFLVAVHILSSMTEVNWRKKMDVYKRWGWSEVQVQRAFRKSPTCMRASEEKIMAVMNFLVNDMGYDSSSIAEYAAVVNYSLKQRVMPRCSVIRILVFRGLIKENIPISSLSVMVDKSFLERFVKKYEEQVPGVMKVFQGQLNYQDLLQN